MTAMLQEELAIHGLRLDNEGNVDWDLSNPEHPQNWSEWRKSYNNAMIFWLEFFMTAISNTGTTAADSSRAQYGISRTFSYFAFVSIYLIGQTCGGLFCAPISETFGRRTLYIISSLIFCIFNAIVGAVPSLIAVFFGRFVSGFIAAIPATVAFGNFADTHDWEARIWIGYFYTLCASMGLVLGPIFAAYTAQAIGCKRWIYYIATIASFVSTLFAFGISESNASILLDRKVKRIVAETGYTDLKVATSATKMTTKPFLQDSLFRPLKFLFTQPIVILCAFFASISDGLAYGLTEGLTIVYMQYGWTRTQTSLAFIPLLLGLLLNILPRFYDQHLFVKYRAQKRQLLPETKIRSFPVACVCLAGGLWIFSWTIPPLVTGVHWSVSMIGLVLIGFSVNDFAYVLFDYVTDSYTIYAASAVSSLSLARTLTGAAFVLFTTQMYEGLGSNYAGTILVGVATLFSFTPILFLGCGARLREKCSKAVNSEDVVDDVVSDVSEGGGAPSDDAESGDLEKDVIAREDGD